jgi:hypothetical protein
MQLEESFFAKLGSIERKKTLLMDFPIQISLPSRESLKKEELRVTLPTFSFKQEKEIEAVGIDGARDVVDLNLDLGSILITIVACFPPDKEGVKGWGIYSPSQGESFAFKGAALMTEPLFAQLKLNKEIIFLDGSALTFLVSLASALSTIDDEPEGVRENLCERLIVGAEALKDLWGKVVFCPKTIRKRHLARMIEKKLGKKVPYSDLHIADLLLEEGEAIAFASNSDEVEWPQKSILPISLMKELSSNLKRRKLIYFKKDRKAYKIELWGDFNERELLSVISYYFKEGRNLLTQFADKEVKRKIKHQIGVNKWSVVSKLIE